MTQADDFESFLGWLLIRVLAVVGAVTIFVLMVGGLATLAQMTQPIEKAEVRQQEKP